VKGCFASAEAIQGAALKTCHLLKKVDENFKLTTIAKRQNRNFCLVKFSYTNN